MDQGVSSMERFRRLAAAAACLIVGVASFALSYVALRDVAVEVGAVPAHLGFLLPIVVDGGVICGSAVIWSLSKSSVRRPVFPFLFVGTLVVISVVINANHAGEGWLSKGIASLPPLILLGALELVASQGRRLGMDQERRAETVIAPPFTAPGHHRRADAAETTGRSELHEQPSGRAEPCDHLAGPAVVQAPRDARTSSSDPGDSGPGVRGSRSHPVPGSPLPDIRVSETPSRASSFVQGSGGISDFDSELGAAQAPARRRSKASRKPLRVRAEEPLS